MSELVLVAVAAFGVTLIAITVMTGRILERRTFREMATVACPQCSRPLGLQAVVEGTDPFATGLVDGMDEHYRNVRCASCAHPFIVCLDPLGDGPRLSVHGANEEPWKVGRTTM